MRLVEYNEEEVFQEAGAYIGKHCRPFMKDMMSGGEFMYSGRKKRDDWFVGTVRKDRKPVDTHDDVHTKMDIMFLKKFGFRARSNVLFCTGSSNTTSYYGDAYSIWPIGKYKFVYSPVVRDITVELDNLESDYRNDNRMRLALKSKAKKKDEEDERVDTWLKMLIGSYTDKDIKAAIKSKKEIMLHCDKYVALNFHYSLKLLASLKANKAGKI